VGDPLGRKLRGCDGWVPSFQDLDNRTSKRADEWAEVDCQRKYPKKPTAQQRFTEKGVESARLDVHFYRGLVYGGPALQLGINSKTMTWPTPMYL
jgi:hypothetical protein